MIQLHLVLRRSLSAALVALACVASPLIATSVAKTGTPTTMIAAASPRGISVSGAKRAIRLHLCATIRAADGTYGCDSVTNIWCSSKLQTIDKVPMRRCTAVAVTDGSDVISRYAITVDPKGLLNFKPD